MGETDPDPAAEITVGVAFLTMMAVGGAFVLGGLMVLAGLRASAVGAWDSDAVEPAWPGALTALGGASVLLAAGLMLAGMVWRHALLPTAYALAVMATVSGTVGLVVRWWAAASVGAVPMRPSAPTFAVGAAAAYVSAVALAWWLYRRANQHWGPSEAS